MKLQRIFESYPILFVLFVQANTQQFQEQKIQSYDPCKLDTDCKTNSFCFGNDDNQSGKCKCVDGFELVRNSTYYECMKGVKLGDACKSDIQCQVTASKLALCDSLNICSCNSMSHGHADGICYLTVKINDLCMTDQNCYLSNGNYGYCTNGHCECAINHHPTINRTSCIANKRLGEVCSSNEECEWTPNAKCQEVCRCGSGYILTRSGKECMKAATSFGENCTIDAQCSDYLQLSLCINGQCGCSKNFHPYGNRCVRTVLVNGRCQENAQCIYDRTLEKNVNCTNGVCECIYGMDNGACKIERTVDDGSSSVNLTATLGLLISCLFTFTYFVVI